MAGKIAFVVLVFALVVLQSAPSSANCKLLQLALAQLGLPAPVPVLPPIPGSCGPQPTPLPVLQAPPITLPAYETPIIPLPSPPIPPPKTLAHKCVCTKTVVKPQVVQRCISIPSIQRYLKTSYTPVLENIAYKASPRCGCGCGCTPCVAAAAALPPCACRC